MVVDDQRRSKNYQILDDTTVEFVLTRSIDLAHIIFMWQSTIINNFEDSLTSFDDDDDDDDKDNDSRLAIL